MPTSPHRLALQEIIESAHTPAVSYAYVKRKEPDTRLSIAVGKKNDQAANTEPNTVDDNTRFPASSLSKIVFTYLVLQLVKKKQLDLDQPLHAILKYEKFMVNGKYPKKATHITARHVLSHTTGLPNWAPDSPKLAFSSKFDLGEGYSYSGEAFLYLQKAIEKKMGKDLETLAKKYVFKPLGMKRSTFLPQLKDDTNIVEVHTQLGQSNPIDALPEAHAAASLLTTADDFSKFMSAWLESDDPILQQAFKPPKGTVEYKICQTCGLGWHLYKNKDEVIAYQYGANPNTHSFVAINVKGKKGAVFFTNSENGMSIATQVLNSQGLPYVGDLQGLFQHMHYGQSDEPGWQETYAGKVYEEQGNFEEARHSFEKAVELSPRDEDKQRCFKWFNAVHQVRTEFTTPLENFRGIYHSGAEISIREDGLIYKHFDKETKLVRVSETEFLPEKDQTFKISFDKDGMKTLYIQGYEETSLLRSKSPLAAEKTGHYKSHIEKMRSSEPGYMAPTESSKARKRESSPTLLQTTPKPPWKP